jgi:hypothetical protein
VLLSSSDKIFRNRTSNNLPCDSKIYQISGVSDDGSRNLSDKRREILSDNGISSNVSNALALKSQPLASPILPALSSPPLFTMWLAWLAFSLSLASPTFAGVKEVWWNLTYVSNANPDGLQERRVIGVNGTWPCVSTGYPRLKLKYSL